MFLSASFSQQIVVYFLRKAFAHSHALCQPGVDVFISVCVNVFPNVCISVHAYVFHYVSTSVCNYDCV